MPITNLLLQRLQLSFRIRFKKYAGSWWPPRHYPLPFIILSAPRTGSTLLHTYLNSHWNVMSFGEYLGRCARNNNTPLLEKYIGLKRGGMIRAVGCKVMYDYFGLSQLNASLEYLKRQDQLKVIHLTRTNLLESYVSLLQARSSGDWTKSGDSEPVEIDMEACLEYFARLEKEQHDCEAYFGDNPVLHITYEDLVERKDDTLRQVNKFLEVKNQHLKSVLQMQREGDLSQRILNFDEVSERLKGTKWERFISEASRQRNP